MSFSKSVVGVDICEYVVHLFVYYFADKYICEYIGTKLIYYHFVYLFIISKYSNRKLL